MPTSPSGSCLSAVMAAQDMCSTQALSAERSMATATLCVLGNCTCRSGSSSLAWHG